MTNTTFGLIYGIYRGVILFLNIIQYIVLAYCVMSWFVRPTNRLFIWISRFAQVIVMPFRPIANWLIDRGLRIDISPLLAIFAINIIQRLFGQLLYYIL